jgi:DNA-directed RNA polymerase subunit RPC12/RpoP
MESARLILDLTSFFVEMVKRVMEAVSKFDEEYDAASLEEFVREQTKALGAVVFEYCWALRCRERGRPASVECTCGRRRLFKGRAERAIRTTLGPMDLTERFRYRCPVCGRETVLGDELKGEGDFSELAERLLAYAGQKVGGMFAEAKKTVKRFLGMDVSPQTIENVCLRRGRRVIASEVRALTEPHRVKVEDRAGRVVVGADGVLIGRVDPAHRTRSSAKKGKVPGKGKLANFWKEVKTCVVYCVDAGGKAVGRKTYYATQAGHETFGHKLVTEARRRGAEFARELIFIGDGAKWIWNLCAREFPKAIQVLDWYHAVEHLWDVGRAYFGEGSDFVTQWVKAREGELYAGGVASVIDALKAMADQVGPPPEGADETDRRVVLWRNAGYFEDNACRMRYDEYRAKGIPLASGVVESACKHVVASRLKGPGMRWDEEGAEAVLHLRSLELNDRWDTFWEQNRAA